MNYLLTHSILNAASRRPDHIAFQCGAQSLTFAALADQMNQLARLLQELGVKKGECVGIYLNRSLETALAMYGIMQAGAIYVPLDPNAPPKRTRFLLEDCEIRYLISNNSRRRQLKKVFEEESKIEAIIGVEGDWPMRAIAWQDVFSMPKTLLKQTSVLGRDLAYIIYTSGSTGQPKGIMHTHYSGLSYAQLTASTYQLHADDRFGNHSPIHFDISTLGYFTAPYLGATTVIVPDAHTKLPASLSQLIEKEQLTVWYSVPLALTQLLHLGVLEERDLSNLRWVLFAGETFPTKYLKALMNFLPKAEFSNIYGPAETNQCTYFNMDRPPLSNAPIPLGQIWEDTEMLIIDEQDQEVTPGETGELLIRSATMMEGYWKKPELSKKGFLEKELLPGFSKTFYRTGDLVRQDEEGCLHFLGRRDQQVKVRGYRVELEAVESVVAAQKTVREAIIFPYRNKKEEVVIIGVVRLQEQVEATETDLLNAIKDQLPHYALPQSIFFLDDFPRTGTGKVNRPIVKNNLLKQIEEIHG